MHLLIEYIRTRDHTCPYICMCFV